MFSINAKSVQIITGVCFVLLLLLQYQLWFDNGGMLEALHLKQAIRSQQEKNVALQDRNLVLRAEVEDLKQGNEAIEERARMELGMVKTSETYYQFVA